MTWRMGRGLANLVRKARRNGRGEANAGIVSRRTVFVTGVLGLAVLTAASPLPLALRIPVLVALLAWRLARLRHKNPRHFAAMRRRPAALALLPVLALVADLAHLAGHALGLIERTRERGLALPSLFRPVRMPRPAPLTTETR